MTEPLSLSERLKQRMQEANPDLSGGAHGSPSSLSQQIQQRKSSIMEEKFPDARVLTPSGDQKDIGWSQVGSEALSNLPRSTYEAGAAMVHPFLHPIETAENIGALGKSIYSKAKGALGIEQDPAQKAKDEAMANALGEFYSNRYGSMSGFKQALAKDPMGVLLDISVPFTGGEMALARAPGVLGKIGKASGVMAEITDPMRSIPAALGVVAKAPGVKPVVEGIKNAPAKYFESQAKLAPGTLETAYEAGRNPSPALEPFVEHMRGTAPSTDIISQIDDIYSAKADARKAGYLAGMRGPVAQNVVDITPIRNLVDQNIQNTAHLESGAVMNEVKNIIDNFQNNGVISGYAGSPGYRIADPANPTVFDVDKLKQRIGEIAANKQIPGAAAAGEVRQKIAKLIRDTNPEYGEIMDKYADLSEQLKEIKYLAGTNKQVAEARLTKLMRGAKNDKNKQQLLEEVFSTNPELRSAIMGSSVSDMGRVGATDFMLYALGSGLVSHPAGLGLAGAHYLSESPRVVGEAAYKAGKIAKKARSVIDSKYARPIVDASKGSRPFMEELGKYEERKQQEKQKKKFLEGMVPAQANGGRVARADGGRIDVLRGARALMRAAENAKKSISKTTEPLLEQPDEHIAQALDMAKRHI